MASTNVSVVFGYGMGTTSAPSIILANWSLTSVFGESTPAYIELGLVESNGSAFNITIPLEDSGEPRLGILIVKSILIVTIMLLAVIGNILVITAVQKFEKLRITANSFIVSLAFADLLVAVLVMPFNASQEIAGRWVFSGFLCDIFNANDVLFSTASLLHLCCISMDRYIAITDPFHYEQRMSNLRVALMLVCAWGASALISHIPIHLGWYTTEEYRDIQDSGFCEFRVNKIYAAISSTISFWTPTLIMVFTYVKIFREARRQENAILNMMKSQEHTLIPINNNGQAQNGSASHPDRLTVDRRKLKKEHKAAKTLGVIMGAFLCCWLPFFLWYVSSTMCGDSCSTPDIVVSILFWVGYFNSALNPIIYAFCNRDFRNAFKKLLHCDKLHRCCCKFRLVCCCRKSGPESQELRTFTNATTRLDKHSFSTSNGSPRRAHAHYDTLPANGRHTQDAGLKIQVV